MRLSDALPVKPPTNHEPSWDSLMTTICTSWTLVLSMLYWHAHHVEPKLLEVDGALVSLIEEAEVPAQVAGVLLRVHANEGQLVQPGDLLVQLDDAEARLALGEADVALKIARKHADSELSQRQAQKTLEIAEAELGRANDAVAKFRKSVSQTEIDQLGRAVERARIELEQAREDAEVAALTAELKQHQHEIAMRGVERRGINAPFAGMVVEIKAHRGEWVEPGATVVRVIRLESLRVECFIDAAMAERSLVGNAATLDVDVAGEPGATFPARVVYVSPEIDPVNSQVRLWAEVQNPELRLRPGLRGTLRIERPTHAEPER